MDKVALLFKFAFFCCDLVLNIIIHTSRQSTRSYQAKIKGSAGDQKALYKVMNQLVGKNKSTQLPEHNDPQVLVNGLADLLKETILQNR